LSAWSDSDFMSEYSTAFAFALFSFLVLNHIFL
jgi:hypothetical protein